MRRHDGTYQPPLFSFMRKFCPCGRDVTGDRPRHKDSDIYGLCIYCAVRVRQSQGRVRAKGWRVRAALEWFKIQRDRTVFVPQQIINWTAEQIARAEFRKGK